MYMTIFETDTTWSVENCIESISNKTNYTKYDPEMLP